ncbi:retrovirus-related pol polyprotein from transposon TNT 1-94 [Tanacetum coccineum]|uniref:Retrovirus-related pol polyprotein from transposon TNT 1-94 n=1 Tax=Tanacetum coccineum TaxID=301880 RepID=A0ABQ5I1M5_9ASTR
MCNNNNNLQTQTSSAFHNAIVEAGGKDHPQMLAHGRRNGDVCNCSMETKKWIDAEAEAVQIILSGIDNDIYSTVDACPNAMEMWKAIKRLKQEWQRFVTLVKQSQELKIVSYHKLYDILKQHQNEVNEIRAKRLARTANPFALVAQQQPVYYPPPNLTHYTQKPEIVIDDEAFSKEKEIDQLMALISIYFKKIYKPTNNNLKTSSNTRNINVDNTPRSDRRTGYDRQIGQYDNQRVVIVAGARENLNDELEDQELEAHYMYMAKIQEVILDAADNSGPIFDIEPLEKVHNSDDNYNVFANERQQPESVNDTYLVEQCDINTTPDSLDMSINGGEVDQDDQMLQEEREMLVSLIEQMKIKIDGSKQNNKYLESSKKALREANTFLNNELKRTKKPIVVPISTREPKRTVNQSIVTPHRRIVASESTIQKPRRNVKPNVSLPLGTESKTTNISEPKTIRGTTLSNTPLSSNSFAAHINYHVHRRLWVLKAYDGKSQAINFVEKFLGSRGTDLYSITLQEITSHNPICLMAKASSSHAWLWHHRISHLNFDTINLLLKNDIVNGLPKLKLVKDHLSSSCELGKAKRKSFKTKTTPSSKGRLLLLRMDLCGPMRVESINGKKYVLVIVDDYSEYTWTHFLRSKDETPEVLIDFLRMIQVGLHAQTKEKGDACIIAGYSTQSKGYRVYKKRTRLIIENIHVNFDKFPQMASDDDSSDLAS